MIAGQARNSGPGAARAPRAIDEPSYTIRAAGSGAHPSGTEWVLISPPHLRNNNTANAATRQMNEPAPTLYFGQRMNYCAWEGGAPPELGVMMGALNNDTEVPMTQTALDLFAGAGGWSLACKRLGIDEVGVENMPAALLTRAAAGFKTHDVTDVWDVDYAALRGQYDGLIASPPCQTFSLAGKGAGRKALDNVLEWIQQGIYRDLGWMRDLVTGEGFDDRTALVLTPLHAAWEMRPEWIAWEQVPTVLPVWEACADELRSWGYSVWTGNLQAEQYGVPQTRKRALLIAHREREVGRPEPTHSKYYPRDKTRLDEGVLPWVSMAEALGWGDFTMVSNYGTGGDPANRGTRVDSDPAPAVTSKIDRNVVYRATKMPNAAVREPVEPAPTVAFGHDANSVRWATPDPDRPRLSNEGSVRVTVAEAGVLQSFPAAFAWQGPSTKQYLQCGNAVPPLLAEAVLRTVVS